MLSPAHDVSTTTTEEDGILAYLMKQTDDFLKNTEDDFENVVDTGIQSGERITESGLDVVKTTVDDVGELGNKLVDDTAGILKTPFVIIAAAIGLMIYMEGPSLVRA